MNINTAYEKKQIYEAPKTGKDISAKNEEKLSEKAQALLKKLRSQYGDYDIMVGGGDDINSLSKSGTKEFAIIISEDELEKMANDEEYAKSQMDGAMGAIDMAKKIAEENGFASSRGKGGLNTSMITNITVSIEDGIMKYFAEIEKTNAKHNGKTSSEKVTVEADSIEDFTEKIKKIQSENIKKDSDGVVYDKAKDKDPGKKATYSVNKMSAEERAALVQKLKDAFEARKNQLSDIVSKMLSGQAGKVKLSSLFTPENLKNVSEEDIRKAKEDISEDGYFGVKQTSQRMFDFALALAGDDVEKMKEMQAAMEKGYKMAEKAWGDELPEICKDTLAAANKLFDDYYASRG